MLPLLLGRPWVLWALAFSIDIKSIFVEIIRSFTRQSWFSLHRMDTKALKAMLSGILKGKKYFLVLDDFIIRSGQLAEWEELRKILEVGLSGSTIIVITSSPFVKGIRSARCFTLQGLPENDSWSLFTRCAGFDEESFSSLLTPIGKSIVNKCRGCPLAIKTLGSMLRANRDERMWKQINESQVWIPPHAASSALILSFQNMPHELVQCFVCYAISPEDRIMSRDQLVYYWMAQGLLRSKTGNEDLRDIGDRYCMELLSRAFLQLYHSDSIDKFLVHNQAQYLAIYLMQGEVGLVPGLFGDPENVRYVLWNGDQSSLGGNLHKARTFLFKNYVGPVSKSFLEGLISKLSRARVLLFDGSEFEELPESIGKLKLLRYLSLAGNHKLKVLPDSVCNLVNLQTLDLSGCKQLEILPNHMHDLASLRHLILSMNLTSVPEEACESWTSLHLLKICNCPNLNSLSEGIARLTALRVLRICDCPSIASLPNSIKRLTCLKDLSILNCQVLDLTEWDGLEGLRGLQSLHLQGLPMLSKFPEGLQSAADSLQRLVVSNCENLTALPELNNNLLELVIDTCPNVVYLPNEIRAVTTLQVLKIFNCPDLVRKCEPRIGESWPLICHIPEVHVLNDQVIRNRVTSSKKSQGELTLLSHTNQGSPARSPHTPRFRFNLLRNLREAKATDEATTNLPSASTSTLNEHPEFDEQSMDKQEGDSGEVVEMKVDYLKAGPSSQEAPQDSTKQTDVKVLPKARVMVEMKDPHSILLLLPEDYEIEKDTLIQLWMASEHIKDEPMELQGEECFSVILNKGYLLRSGTNFMTGKDRYRINTNKIKELLDGQKDAPAELKQHLSLGCSDVDATTFQTLKNFKELRTLLFFGDNYGHRVREMPGHLFSSLKNLQALDLSRTQIRELPSSIGHVVHLRYLDLSWTLIEWLPDTLCSLDQLQTLKLGGCLNLRELPGQLKRLAKLRHLVLDVHHQLKAMPRGIGALVNLRTLSAFLVGSEDGCRIQELKELNNLSGNFCIAKLEHVEDADEAAKVALYKKEHLEKLELRWTASELSRTHRKSDDILECLQPSTRLKELRILCYEGSIFPSWVSDPKFDKLASITFYKCKCLSELPPLEQLPFLKYLDLIKMNSISKIERPAQLENDIAFFRLEKLEIDEMQSLKAWRWEKRNENDFMSLVELTISGCPELQELDLLTHLSSIKRFEIRECPMLESLSDTQLPESLELIVEDCPNLRVQNKCSEKRRQDWYTNKESPKKSIQEVG